MNSAERLFLEHGVAATTIEQITLGADVAKGTFYLHFDSKEDVLVALREKFIQGLVESINKAVERQDSEDWKGKLSAWCKACVVGYLDAARLHHVVFHESPPSSHESLTDNIIIQCLEALLASGVEAGAWEIDDPQFTAVFLFSAFHGVIVGTMTREKRVNRTRLVRQLEDQCFRSAGIEPRLEEAKKA